MLSIHNSRRAAVVIAASVAFCIYGCIGLGGDSPQVRPNGEWIGGGPPKLQALIQEMEVLRSTRAANKEGISDLVFSASISPDPNGNSELFSGSLPAIGNKHATPFDVVLSAITIDQASVALIAVFDITRSTVTTKQYRWENGRWVNMPLRSTLRLVGSDNKPKIDANK
jgi:hypothetical protein